MVNGGTADYVTYAGTVAAGQSLIIDGREKSCTNNLVNSYDNLTFQHSDWMRLAPGANVLNVTIAGTAQGGTVVVSYYPTYI
jgi:phage-related protein